jgi:truncated hemoglobin YjbI
MKTHLDKFYKLVAKNPALARQFDAIVERKDFPKLAVQLGAKWGYFYLYRNSSLDRIYDSNRAR